MEYVLIGTAGHVDHGKSTLIKALSGIDPDRLKEEKEREMTIDIGFANFLLPGGRLAQIIDVPGHERFIKNMLAGVNTIDLVLFVVDANEGVKPQTREHFDILRILAVKSGIIVITKIDIASPERLEETVLGISELVKGSFLEKAPVIQVSSVTGMGLPELISAIDRLAPDIPQRSRDLPVRLPIDRIFTMSGSGTVITGTLVSGILKVNDTLEVLPHKIPARVRQIQSYGGKVAQIIAGQRAGINLAGIKKEDLIRGNTLAAPGYITPTSIFDASIGILPNCPRPVKNFTRVRLHIGTGEFLGRMVLLDKEKLEPGQDGLIQFKSELPLSVAKDDRFVMRLYAPMITIGGGHIIDAHPVKHKRFQTEIVEQLEALEVSDPANSVEQVLINSGLSALHLKDIPVRVNLPDQEVAQIIKGLSESGRIIMGGIKNQRIMHADNFRLLKDKIVGLMDDFYLKNQSTINIPLKELKSALVKNSITDDFLDGALKGLSEEGTVSLAGESAKLSRYSIKLTDKQGQLRQKLEKIYLDNLFSPPGSEMLEKSLGVKPKAIEEMIIILKEMDILVGLSEGIVIHRQAVTKAAEAARDYLQEHGHIKAGEFTRLLNTSRKYAIPLLEYLDSIRVTKREGDVRVLSRGGD
ncbi:MAG TPA: selenocysteine-specific translation elongation factor [Planctomycetota bacterium]|nr:selenocysteine-specific translation elongation factor [Planctomycetota bacterium]